MLILAISGWDYRGLVLYIMFEFLVMYYFYSQKKKVTLIFFREVKYQLSSSGIVLQETCLMYFLFLWFYMAYFLWLSREGYQAGVTLWALIANFEGVKRDGTPALAYVAPLVGCCPANRKVRDSIHMPGLQVQSPVVFLSHINVSVLFLPSFISL